MLKNRVKLGSAVDRETYEILKNLSVDSRISIAKLLDEAIKDLAVKFKLQQQKINS